MLLEVLIPAFIYTEKVDPITDDKSASLSLVTEDFSLSVKCDRAGKGSIYGLFVSKQYLGSDRISKGWRPLDIRFDKREPIRFDWQYHDHTAIIEGDKVKIVAADLLESRKVAIRAYKYDGRIVDAATEYTVVPSDIWKLMKICDNQWLSLNR